MNAYNFCILFFGFCTFFVSILILLRSPNKIGGRYFVFSFFVTIWAIVHSVLMADDVSFERAMIASRVLNGAALFIPVTWFQFLLGYLNIEGYKKLIVFNYGIVLGLLSISWTDLFLLDVQPILGFKYYTVLGPIYHVYTTVYFTLIPFSFYVLYKHIKGVSNSERKKLLLFFIATASGFMGGATTFSSGYGLMIPPVGFFLMPVYPFVMAYILIRSHMFDERQLTETLRREKLATMSMLAASMNHEIKNPLYVIQGIAESCLSDGEPQNGSAALKVKEYQSSFKKCLEQTQRAIDIVQRFSTFVKPQTEVSHVESIKLADVIQDVLLLVRYEIKNQKMDFKMDVSEDLHINAHRGDIEEVFLNLVLNSCQALKGQENGVFSIRATEKDTKVQVEIKDNGPGMDKTQLSKIFEPFHTTKDEGMGLGLYITKQLVEKNGGTIQVDSQSGAGTTFDLEFVTV